MTAPTHILTALAAVVIVGQVFEIRPDAVHLAACLLGSLAPDIDGGGTITEPGRILRSFIGRFLANLLDAMVELLAATAQTLFGHRGFLHSPFLVGCLAGTGWYLDRDWLVWLSLGYASHVLADALTLGGIPVCSPLSSKRLSLSAMRTGSRSEFLLAVALLVFVCGFGWALLPEDVQRAHRLFYERMFALR